MYKYPWQVDPNTIPDEDKVILFFTDIHASFTKLEYKEWLVQTALKFGVNVIVHGGDQNDHHSLSFHDSEPDAYGTMTEFEKSYNITQEYVKTFPYLYLCESNHDRIPVRKAAKLGLSEHFMKSFHELYNLPDTWVLDNYHIVNNVRFEHGHQAKGGKDGALNTAINNRMSTCTGHYHGNFGVKYQNNGNSQIFGAAGGCLLDTEAYAFRYGKGAANKPILGCIIVFNDQLAIPMPYNYNK